MELEKKYNPGDAEKRWYSHWLDKGYFNSTPDEREAYTIVNSSTKCNRSFTYGTYA